MSFQATVAKGVTVDAILDDFDDENQAVILSTETHPFIHQKKTTRFFTKRYLVTFEDTYEALVRLGRGAAITAEIMMIEDRLHLISFKREA